MLLLILQRYEFSSKSQPMVIWQSVVQSCCWYYKGTNFQANHNSSGSAQRSANVVADTTKVRIFKQITTGQYVSTSVRKLLLILQRYEFSSKSQRSWEVRTKISCCCWYYKGTNFQANHNRWRPYSIYAPVVADTTKVRIFKQITTTI